MIRRPLQYGLGIGLIILGIAGLFLPLLQGVLLILLGVFVLRANKAKSIWDDVKSSTRRLREKRKD